MMIMLLADPIDLEPEIPTKDEPKIVETVNE